MSQTGFTGVENLIVCGSLAVVAVSNVIQRIFKDDLLYEIYLMVLLVCFALLIICFSSILSKLCVREIKSSKKPVWKLKDSDEEFIDELEDSEKGSKARFLKLIKSRRIYEIIYQTALLCLTAGLILEGLSCIYDASVKRDFDYAALMLAIIGVSLLVLVYKVADTYRWEHVKYSYQPFDEFIRVPMKVFVPKMYLYIADNMFSFGSNIFFQFSAIYGLVKVNRMSEEDIKRFMEVSQLPDIHMVLRVIMIIANVSGVMLLVNNLATARKLVMEEFLFTCEKNWHWNMAAIAFLLEGKEVNSLEELAEAITEKSQKEDLTEEEKKALTYIEKPLWKSKPPFVGNRQLSGIPEALQKAKEAAEPSTSNAAEGSNEEPQPSTSNQPSSSTRRPLIVG